MKEAEKKLYARIRSLFMQYGIRSLTMDDIARQLRISKKTIYKHVRDKAQLVKHCVTCHIAEMNDELAEVRKSHIDAVEQMIAIGAFIVTKVGNMHPSVFFDLEKYHPDALHLIEDNKENVTRQVIEDNIRLGIGQGVYRADMDPEIIARAFMHLTDGLLHGRMNNPMDRSFKDTYNELFRYHFYGIATEKGRRLYDQKREQTP